MGVVLDIILIELEIIELLPNYLNNVFGIFLINLRAITTPSLNIKLSLYYDFQYLKIWFFHQHINIFQNKNN